MNKPEYLVRWIGLTLFLTYCLPLSGRWLSNLLGSSNLKIFQKQKTKQNCLSLEKLTSEHHNDEGNLIPQKTKRCIFHFKLFNGTAEIKRFWLRGNASSYSTNYLLSTLGGIHCTLEYIFCLLRLISLSIIILPVF